MTAAEYGRPERWPDAMERWLPRGAAEPGTAAMPSAALLRHGAVPPASMSIPSHAEILPEAGEAGIWNPSTRPGEHL